MRNKATTQILKKSINRSDDDVEDEDELRPYKEWLVLIYNEPSYLRTILLIFYLFNKDAFSSISLRLEILLDLQRFLPQKQNHQH